MQGDPLAMALYGVALLPLAELLREAHRCRRGSRMMLL